ncbi:UNVERIFIED_CONTAM: hypothetical protein RMT77_003630 [Armadillidium vulgare]
MYVDSIFLQTSCIIFVIFISKTYSTSEESTEPSPKLFGLLKLLNPSSWISVTQFTAPKTPQEKCEDLGGTYRDPECLKYFEEELTFADARLSCIRDGGDIWVPPIEDIENPFFFQKLLIQFPKLFEGKGSFWIGIIKKEASLFTGVDGEEAWKTSLIRMNDEANALACGFLTYSLGRLYFSSAKCDNAIPNPPPPTLSFVCEYDVHTKPEYVTTYQHGLLKI